MTIRATNNYGQAISAAKRRLILALALFSVPAVCRPAVSAPLAMSPTSKPQTVSASPQRKDWLAPAWRSAILPGWGQFYNKQSTKGLLLGGATIGLFAGVVTTYYLATDAENQYHSLGPGLEQSQYDAPYNTWTNMALANYILYGCFGFAYAYNIIDAIWNAKTTGLHVFQAPKLYLALTGRGIRANYEVLEF